MLTMHVPMLLALLGTVLMAVVIFAPAPVAANVTLSLAPPLAPPPFERWNAPGADPFAPPPFDGYGAMNDTRTSLDRTSESEPCSPAWPLLVDPRAASCDAASRLALVDALTTVRAPWADAILRRALDDESDALVRDALVAALGLGAGER